MVATRHVSSAWTPSTGPTAGPRPATALARRTSAHRSPCPPRSSCHQRLRHTDLCAGQPRNRHRCVLGRLQQHNAQQPVDLSPCHAELHPHRHSVRRTVGQPGVRGGLIDAEPAHPLRTRTHRQLPDGGQGPPPRLRPPRSTPPTSRPVSSSTPSDTSYLRLDGVHRLRHPPNRVPGPVRSRNSRQQQPRTTTSSPPSARRTSTPALPAHRTPRRHERRAGHLYLLQQHGRYHLPHRPTWTATYASPKIGCSRATRLVIPCRSTTSTYPR